MAKISKHKLILGTVQFGLHYGINNTKGQVSLEDSHQILEYAFHQGIRILDSAEAYGNAHQVIGAFHKKYPNKTFEIITKLPHQFDADIKDKVHQYLEDLQIEKLHALLFHSFDSYKKNKSNFEILNQLKTTGKIKKIGVSVYTNQEVEEVLLDDDVDIIQLPFNLLDNSNLRGDILKKAKEKGKIIHTRSALLQGLFFKDINSTNKTVLSLKDQLLQISKISKDNNISVAHLALNYCLQEVAIDNVLIGVDSMTQIEDNIAALNYSIDDKILEEINKIKIDDINLLNPSLWK
jgi:aryl-alcohol dehydrogenase-like predicted oxidoreductase